MQRSWLKIGMIVVLLVFTGILWDSSMVWASPDQAPLRQTVPTRVKTDTPGPATNTPDVVPATNTPGKGGATSAPPTSANASALPTATQLQIPTQTQTATVTQPAPTATRSTSTATPLKLTTTSVLSTATPVPQPSRTTDGNVPVMAIGGIMVLILGALVFALRRRRSR